MSESPKAKEKAASGAEPKATDAAQRKAEELGVDLANVDEPTGKDDSVTVEDVEKAAEAKAEAASNLVYVKLNPELLLKEAVAPDGTIYKTKDALDPAGTNIVSEAHFDENLSGAVDSEGRAIFLKEEEG